MDRSSMDIDIDIVLRTRGYIVLRMRSSVGVVGRIETSLVVLRQTIQKGRLKGKNGTVHHGDLWILL